MAKKQPRTTGVMSGGLDFKLQCIDNASLHYIITSLCVCDAVVVSL